MRTREEAVKFVTKQFDDVNPTERNKGGQVHYGLQELRDLMDFLYEQEPQSEAEQLNAKTWWTT